MSRTNHEHCFTIKFYTCEQFSSSHLMHRTVGFAGKLPSFLFSQKSFRVHFPHDLTVDHARFHTCVSFSSKYLLHTCLPCVPVSIRVDLGGLGAKENSLVSFPRFPSREHENVLLFLPAFQSITSTASDRIKIGLVQHFFFSARFPLEAYSLRILKKTSQS